MFITAVRIIKLFARGERDSGGHVPRKTTSGGLCGLVCPPGHHEGKRCVFITAVPLIKMFARGEGKSGGHVLRETTSV